MELFIYQVGIQGKSISPCQKFNVTTTAEAEEQVHQLNQNGDVYFGKLVQGDSLLTIDPKGYEDYSREV